MHPVENIDEWASTAKDWVTKPTRLKVLVIGDIIHDNYIVASPLEGRGRFGIYCSVQLPDTPETNIRVLGGAARGFEFIRKFTGTTRLLGKVGNDSEGNWIISKLAQIHGNSVGVEADGSISTPLIIRVLCSHLTEKGSQIRYSRINRYIKDQEALMSFSEKELENEIEGLGLILVFDHGLGGVSPPLLRALDTICSSVRREVTTKRPCVVARLKHSDVLAYCDIELDALVLSWAHIAPGKELPRTADNIRENTHATTLLLDFLSNYPKCKNFIFLGKDGDILLQVRLPGTSFSANLYSYSIVADRTERAYYSGAGHVFTGVVGLALASEADCSPESAVCLGLIAAIAQRQKTDIDMLDRKALCHYIDTHPPSKLVNCNYTHLLTHQEA